MKDNTKKYRLQISNSKIIDQCVLPAIPILMGIIGSLLPLILKNIPTWKYIAIYVIIASILIFFYFIIGYRTKCIEADRNVLDEEIVNYREILNENKGLLTRIHDDYEYIESARSMTIAVECAAWHIVRTLCAAQKVDATFFKQVLSNALSTILKSFNRFYNLAHEQMTIAIYYYDSATNQFYDLESAKPEYENLTTNMKNKGRIWSLYDESHISFVARRNEQREFVFDNINKELKEPINSKEQDKNKYVSSISIPLYDVERKSIIGVFSITSNYENRFNDKNGKRPVISYMNGMFQDIMFNVAILIESMLNLYFSDYNSKKGLLLYILEDYDKNSPNLLNNSARACLEELRKNIVS